MLEKDNLWYKVELRLYKKSNCKYELLKKLNFINELVFIKSNITEKHIRKKNFDK